MRFLHVAVATLLLASVTACSDEMPSAPTQEDAGLAPSYLLVGGSGTAAPIRSRLFSDMCVDVVNSVYEKGRMLEMWSCNQKSNQQFTWKSSGQIVPSSSQGLCFDAGQGPTGNGIGLWSCNGHLYQKWSASAAGEIKGVNGKCLGMVAAVHANRTRLSVQTCDGSAKQKWDNAAGGSPPPPPPPPGPLPGGIPISPGQSIQALVTANPAGTTFILKAGTHVRQSVIPKSGDRFIGEPGAVLDGQNVTQQAFHRGRAPFPSNVTIRGLKITRYAPRSRSAAVDAGGHGPTERTTGWVIDNNEVSYNGEYGIRIGNSTQVINNNVHHNTRLNVCGNGNNTLVSGNEIAFGHYLNSFDANDEGGGTKFTNSDALIFRNNYVHDNLGNGVHMDENNINTIIEGNRIDHNGSEGISIEISYKTTIFNNTVTNNGWFDPRNRYTYIWNAGIAVKASPNVEVYRNTVSGNYAGIVAVEQDRSVDPPKYGPHIVQNLYVHDNIITQSNLPRTSKALSVGAGMATDIAGNTVVFTSRNNRFRNNIYHLGSNPRPFAWMGGTRTEAQWKGYGQDLTGIFNH